jgi:hypothetical protein
VNCVQRTLITMALPDVEIVFKLFWFWKCEYVWYGYFRTTLRQQLVTSRWNNIYRQWCCYITCYKAKSNTITYTGTVVYDVWQVHIWVMIRDSNTSQYLFSLCDLLFITHDVCRWCDRQCQTYLFSLIHYSLCKNEIVTNEIYMI